MNWTYLAAGVALCIACAGVVYVDHARGEQDLSSWVQYSTPGFSISYPPDYILDDSYVYDIAPGRRSMGVKFTVPAAVVSGSNLSSDSYVSVESLPTLGECSATPYLYSPETLPTLSEDAHTYSVAREDGAAAGSLYEEEIYVRTGESRCMAVRYFIHSTNLANYERGAVRPFDREALLARFDLVRRTLVLK